MTDLLSFCWEVTRTALTRYRAAAVLNALNDRYLRDMGLDRADVDAYVRSCWPWPEWQPVPVLRRQSPSLRGCG